MSENNCLHDYECKYISPEATVEVCKLCHKREVFRTAPSGTYNVKAYWEAHRRDYLQPWHKEFKKVYPNAHYGPKT